MTAAPWGPLIQYLLTTDEAALAATGGRYRATARRPEAMSPGRLAFKWFPEHEADCVRRTSPPWPVLVIGWWVRRWRAATAG